MSTSAKAASGRYKTGYCGVGFHGQCSTAGGICTCTCHQAPPLEAKSGSGIPRTGAGVSRVAGYIIGGPEKADGIVVDWVGEIHPNLEAAEVELAAARVAGHDGYGIYELRLVNQA